MRTLPAVPIVRAVAGSLDTAGFDGRSPLINVALPAATKAQREAGMSHEGSLGFHEPRLSGNGHATTNSRLTPAREREELREELLRRIVVREETRQYLRRMPR